MADHAAAVSASAGAIKPPAAAPPRNLLIVALIAVNMLGMVGLGAFLVLRPSGATAPPAAHGDEEGGEHDEHGAEDEEEDEEEDEHEMGPLVEFESMVVNLRAPTTDRYLKLTFQLELRGEEHLEHAETHMPAFRHAVLMYLTSLAIEEVQGADNAIRLRDHLLEMTRATLGRRVVSHIYFTEYLVQ